MEKTLSSTAGPTDEKPLLVQTIGANLADTVAVHGAREAIVVRHQNVRWTYDELSERVDELEKEVLSLIAYEFTSNEIAQKLFISSHTAISHRKNLMVKFGVRNTAGLIRRGFELGYIQLSNTTSGLSLSSETY